jgi:hypothetical protein
MKVAVLFLRLIGIGMLLYGAYSIYMVHAMGDAISTAGFNFSGAISLNQQQVDIVNHIRMAANVLNGGIFLIGALFTRFSAKICVLLTFDYQD